MNDRSKDRSLLLNPWMPVLLGVFLSLLVALMYVALSGQQEVLQRQQIATEAESRMHLISHGLLTQTSSLQRIANRWEIRGGTPQAEFTADALNYIEDFSGIQALEWVDTGFIVRWIVPLVGNEKAQDLNLSLEENRRIALELARDDHTITMTAPIDLVQGGRGHLVYFPIYLQDEFSGFLLAVFNTSDWIDSTFSQSDNKNFTTVVDIANQTAYQSQDFSISELADWQSQIQGQILGQNILLRVYPTQEFFIENKSINAVLSASVGTLLVLLIVTISVLLQRSTRTSQSIALLLKS